MIAIIETGMNARRNTIDTAPDFASAKAKVEAMGVVFMEDDPDGHVDCADAFLKDGRVIAIEPQKVGA